MSGRCWCCSTAGAACSATGWCPGASAWRRRPAQQFETDTLPRFIETQRWYAAKGTPIERARIADHVLWQEGKIELARRAARGRRGRRDRQLLHAARARLGGARRGARAQPLHGRHRQDPPAVERRRDGRCLRRRGVLPGAGRGDGASRAKSPTAQGKLEFRPTAAFGRLAGADFASLPAARPQGSSSNTIVVLGERLILKGYRRLRTGASPELEMGLYPHRCRALRQLRAAGRRAPIPRQGRRADAARDAAGLRRQSGRRLDLVARVPAAPPRGASHRAGHRRAARRTCTRPTWR